MLGGLTVGLSEKAVRKRLSEDAKRDQLESKKIKASQEHGAVVESYSKYPRNIANKHQYHHSTNGW